MKRVVAAIVVLLPVAATSQDWPWWQPPDGTVFHHRALVEVVNGDMPKENYPVWVDVNFTELLMGAGVVGAFDTASVRVVESGEGIDPRPQPCVFEVAPDFRKVANAAGTVAWLLEGTTEPQQRRLWHLYFDLEEHGLKARGPLLEGSRLVDNPYNVVANPSFEVDADADGSPDGWDGFVGGSVVSAGGYPVAHWGSKSLVVEAIPGDSIGAVLVLRDLSPGSLYRAGAYLRVQGSVPENSAAIIAFPGTGTAVRFSTQASLPPPGVWTGSGVLVPAPVDADSMTILCSLSASPDTILLDDFFVLHSPPAVQVAQSAETLPP